MKITISYLSTLAQDNKGVSTSIVDGYVDGETLSSATSSSPAPERTRFARIATDTSVTVDVYGTGTEVLLPAGSVDCFPCDAGQVLTFTASAATQLGQVEVGGHSARVSVSFTRPADTAIYASGDIVANNVTAGSVAPMVMAIGRDGGTAGGMIRRVRLRKSGTSIVNAQFRLHLYSASPTVVYGDNGVWLTTGAANYVGSLDVTCDKTFSDGAAGNGVPLTGTEINFTAATYYGLLEARAAYTPASGETFNVLLEVLQN